MKTFYFIFIIDSALVDKGKVTFQIQALGSLRLIREGIDLLFFKNSMLNSKEKNSNSCTQTSKGKGKSL